MAFRRQLHIPSDPLEEFIEYFMPSWSVRPADPWFSFSSDSQQQDPRNRSDADRGRGFLVRFPSRSVPEKARSDGAMDVQVTDSEFKVAVNVRNFQPEELDVKVHFRKSGPISEKIRPEPGTLSLSGRTGYPVHP
ncbi:hypothetical protein HOLleu_09538 [Holothuria leucospilota]|uniref:SHSP domain-containing protein n=1 Tax=Holothuria leucospilota TaxID=206669 RepID=A0A9Q1CBM9_HOLLE|nr:hypothetical protein HOLleu_09538 [Holothuria leucospilota]